MMRVGVVQMEMDSTHMLYFHALTPNPKANKHPSLMAY